MYTILTIQESYTIWQNNKFVYSIFCIECKCLQPLNELDKWEKCMPQTMNYVTLAIHVSKMMVSTSHAIYETLLWALKFSIHLIDSITILWVSGAMIFSAKCTLPWHPLLEACHQGNTWSIYHRPTWRLLQIKDHVTLDIHVSSWMRVSTSSLHKFS